MRSYDPRPRIYLRIDFFCASPNPSQDPYPSNPNRANPTLNSNLTLVPTT